MPDLPEFSNTNIEPEIQNPYSSSIQNKNTFQLIADFWKNFTGKQRVVFGAIMVLVFALPLTAGLIARQQSLERSRAFSPVTPPISPAPQPTPTSIPGSCVRQTPTFSVTPSTQTAKAGQKVVYKITIVTNDNSTQCNNWDFTLSVKLPTTDWKGSTTMSKTFLVGPRNTVSFDYYLTSPTTVKAGSFNINFILTDKSKSYSSTQTVIYTMSTNISTPKPSPKGIPIPSIPPVYQ